VAVAALVVLTVAFLQRSPVSALELGAADLTVCADCDVSTLEAAIERANDGDRIEVRGGVFPGGLTIDKPIQLVGIDGPVIDGGGEGTLVQITVPNVTIDGFTLRNSGTSHDKEDSGILVDAGPATIVNNILENVLFGIYVRKADGTVIQNNSVRALPVDVGLRGDGIKIWYANNVVVEGNHASDGRDIILWYSNDAVVTGNVFDGNRYGMHLMFSDGARIQGNSLDRNTIGLYVMYSRNIEIIGNSLSNNSGAPGGGLGLKDVDDAHVEGNRFVNNQIGAQIDTSPREPGVENYFIGNVFAFNDLGISIQPAVRHNTFLDNSFIDNNEHVSLMGRGELKDITWAVDGRGNYWSDYAGYDANGDGVGDLPYVSQQLFESLVADYPELRLFSYSPASMAIDFAAEAFPSFRPQVRFEDPNPLMNPAASAYLPVAARQQAEDRTLLGFGAGVAALGAALGAVRLRKRPRYATPVETSILEAIGS
jgi:nitrous oxidase accessory protein